MALNAGVDMDMASESMIATLKKSLNEGKVTMTQINVACRRVLEAKYKLGLLNKLKRIIDAENISRVTLTPENKKVAKEAALKSIVLLENKNNILPIKKTSSIALIGPFANSQPEMFSTWSFTGDPRSVVTMFDGIKKITNNVIYAQGTQISNDTILNRKLHLSFDPELQKQLVAEALEVANKSDVILAVLGESTNMSGESKSRVDISIPQCQQELLKALKNTGKPVVLILVNGRPLTILDDLKYADAVLETWRLGTEAGDAIADVVFGNYNPSGKITMTFPRSVGQIPVYYNHKNTGRPIVAGESEDFVSSYKDQSNLPLYPFGYGLSYTSFKYGNINISDTLLVGREKTLKTRINITNNGKYAGEETVQLYIRDMVASITRPIKELKQFKKVHLESGETKEVFFEITPEDLKFYNSNLIWDWESGAFTVYIGTNSEEVKQAKFIWNK